MAASVGLLSSGLLAAVKSSWAGCGAALSLSRLLQPRICRRLATTVHMQEADHRFSTMRLCCQDVQGRPLAPFRPTWVRAISAVAASSIMLWIGMQPEPPSQASR